MQRRRRLRQRGEVGSLRQRQFVDRLVEVDQRGSGDAVRAKSQEDFVQIEFEDLVLRISALDAHRQQRFLDLAGERHLVGQKEVLRDLLRDGRGALRAAIRAIILRVDDAGARHAVKVEPAVLVEALVFRGEEGVDDRLRHRLDRQVKAPFLGVLTEQRPVRRMHARHHRRLVVLQLRIVRQIAREMPDETSDGANADEEQDCSGGEQETHEAQQQSHRLSNPPRLPACRSRVNGANRTMNPLKRIRPRLWLN